MQMNHPAWAKFELRFISYNRDTNYLHLAAKGFFRHALCDENVCFVCNSIDEHALFCPLHDQQTRISVNDTTRCDECPNTADTVLLPCGCSFLCATCACQYGICPRCNTNITAFVTVYLNDE
jgi:hypothetical protein